MNEAPKSFPTLAEANAAMVALGRALAVDVERATRSFGKMLHPAEGDGA